MAALDTNLPVAVIGAGTMGAGIAQVAATAGHKVYLYDTRTGAAASAIENISKVLYRLVEKEIIDARQAQECLSKLNPAQSLKDLADSGLVVEAIVEKLEAKTGLFKELETIVSPNCILASNTSSIPITAIGATLERPNRLGGLHFFNPAPRMPLVEVISGLDTSADIAQTLYDTAKAWGKSPVMATSTPGFIVNRVARPFYAEGLRLLQEQTTDPATLDYVIRNAGGFRMGPCELTDLIGQDVNNAVTKSVWAAFYNSPRFEPSLVQQSLVDAGRLGRKSGKGFFDYSANATKPEPKIAEPKSCPQNIIIFGESELAKALSSRLTAANIGFTNANTADANLVAQANDCQIYQTDGRSASQLAFDTANANTVCLDLALDYSQTKALALSKARQCSDTAFDAAIGLLHACGINAVPVKDVAGLIVMRTVAMLINEAADTVNQGVCNAQDVDIAMCQGVNYPLGPLAWCNRIGVNTVYQVLLNMQVSEGERYRPCTAIQSAIYSGKQINVT